MKLNITILIGFTLIALAGCEQSPNTGKGFSLPEGNAANGKIAYVELACNRCHSVADIEQVPSEGLELPNVKLGGTVLSIKTYGDLVTSIINPSHRILRGHTQGIASQKLLMNDDGNSKMPIYNDVMTVTQLVDLVTFLEGHYELDLYYRTRYNRFGPAH